MKKKNSLKFAIVELAKNFIATMLFLLFLAIIVSLFDYGVGFVVGTIFGYILLFLGIFVFGKMLRGFVKNLNQ